MANANDPASIPYIIAENGFFYVAYKEKNPYVPEIVVSAKGVANGLSEKYNDGYDFGPDSYDPNSTASIPYTDTSGTAEAVSYAMGFVTSTSSLVPDIFLKDQNYVVTGTFDIPVPSAQNGFGLKIYGSSDTTTITLNYNGGYFINAINGSLYDISLENIRWVIGAGYSADGLLYADNSNSTNGLTYFSRVSLHNVNFGGTASGATETGNGIYVYNANFVEMYGCDNGASGINSWNFTSSSRSSGSNNVFLANSNGYYQGSHLRTFVSTGGHVFQPIVSDVDLLAVFGAYNFAGILAGDVGTIVLDGVSCGYNPFQTTSAVSVTVNQMIINGLVYAWDIIKSTTNPSFINLYSGSSVTINNFQLNGITSTNPSYQIVDIPYNSPTISANPPASGTAYQNTNPYAIEIDLPVYATTSGTAGYVTIAKGSSSTSLTTIGNQFVNGSTSSTSVDIIRLRVPAGWYYEFTASGVTFGTASVFAD